MARYEDRFRLAVENAVVGFLIENPADGTILEANDAACALLQRDVTGLVGSTWLDITFPDDRESDALALGCLMRGEQTCINLRKRYLTPGGGHVWLDVTVTTVRGADGQPRYNISQLRDASVETSLAELVSLVADIPAGDVLSRALMGGMRRRHGVTVVGVYLVCEERNVLTLVGSAGWTQPELAVLTEIPADLMNVPVAMATSSSAPVIMKVRHVPEINPLACRWFESHPLRDIGEVAAFPIRSQGATVGVMYLEASVPFDRSWAGMSAMESVTNTIAPWLLIQRDRSECAPENPRRRAPLSISDRQRTIVRLVREGKTNRAIADELGYSEPTVRADLAHLSRMLGAHGRLDVANKAGRAGL